ncbi:MAG: sulfotransferase [Desulfomonilaceae bacterium]
MLCVFGSPRSGTTLLAQCLSSHSQIFIPYETDFLAPVAFIFDRIPDLQIGRKIIVELITNTEGFRRGVGEYLTPDEIRDLVNCSEYSYAAVVHTIYQAIGAKNGATIVGDKSPNDLLFLRMIVKVGGLGAGVKVIHLVRDLRDVMASLHERNWAADLDLWFPRFGELPTFISTRYGRERLMHTS